MHTPLLPGVTILTTAVPLQTPGVMTPVGVPVQPVATATGVPHTGVVGTRDAGGTAPQHGAVSEATEAPATTLPSISNARLVQSMNGSAMQVDLHTEDFGRVSVHTAYGRDAISTQITLENSQMGSALGTALNTHVAAMEQKLGGDHGLRATVSVDTRGAGSAADGGGQEDRSRNDGRYSSFAPQNATQTQPSTPPISVSAGIASLASASTPVVLNNRLDIRI